MIRNILLSVFISFFQLSSYAQSSSYSVVKGWSKCEIEINLDIPDIPLITHFKVKKVNDNLVIDHLGANMNQLQINHFREVLLCLNECYFETFPDSTEIIHFFTKNQHPPSPELNKHLITKYKKKHSLKDDVIVIFSGTSSEVR